MKHLPTPIRFREDINALRAWAVIFVLLFHFKLPGGGGGFIGVDIFFVISGFLMTGIIVKGLEEGKFSIIRFYLARVRRILPALIVMVFVLLVLGWFFLPTFKYKLLAIESIYSLSFLSNFHYWGSSGYFDSASYTKWLLHTWSLSVEWQFYLLFPVILVLIWKIKAQKNILFVSMGLLFIFSLILSVFVSNHNSATAFYLFPTRGWEMAAGSLAFLLSAVWNVNSQYRKIMYVIGWGTLILSLAFLSSEYLWPSGWAIFPVIGTVLIILSNQSDSLLVKHSLLSWLGERSYSLYLWHWPIMVTLYFFRQHNDLSWVLAAILLSLLLAHLSYIFVEVPTRSFLTKNSFKREIYTIFSSVGIVSLMAIIINFADFQREKFAKLDLVVNDSKNIDPRKRECFSAKRRGEEPCIYGRENVGIILMGDSHSGSVITSLGDVAEEKGVGTLFLGAHSCPTIEGIRSKKRKEQCNNFNKWAFRHIEKYNKKIPLILISRTSSYLLGPNEPGREKEVLYADQYFTKKFTFRNEEYKKEFTRRLISTTCKLAKKRDVYLVRPIPEMGINVPRLLSHNLQFKGKSPDIKIPLSSYYERNRLVWDMQDKAAAQCGVWILNPIPYLCDNEFCYGSKMNRSFYSDDDHLSEYGNRLLMPMFETVFKAGYTRSVSSESLQ